MSITKSSEWMEELFKMVEQRKELTLETYMKVPIKSILRNLVVTQGSLNNPISRRLRIDFFKNNICKINSLYIFALAFSEGRAHQEGCETLL